MKNNKPTAPPKGYKLPKWEVSGAYRATAHGYMMRNGAEDVENENGHTYTLEEVEEAMLENKNMQTSK